MNAHETDNSSIASFTTALCGRNTPILPGNLFTQAKKDEKRDVSKRTRKKKLTNMDKNSYFYPKKWHLWGMQNRRNTSKSINMT